MTDSSGSNPFEPKSTDSQVSPATSGDTIVPGVATPQVPIAPASRVDRRRAVEEFERSSQQTSRQRLFMVSAGILFLLVAVAIAWFIVSRPPSPDTPAPKPSPSSTEELQPTLLFQIRDDTTGIAVDNGLLSVGGPRGRANMITIPPTTVMDVATGGALPFGQITQLPDPNGSASALSDATGVVVDATAVLDQLSFSALVDAVGGVVVDVDTDVIVDKPDGTAVIEMTAGKGQLLQGPDAAIYATYLAVGEPEAARMARFSQTLRLVLAKLPDDKTKVEAILTGLGASARATLPTSDLAAFLLRFRTDVINQDVTYESLPVTEIDTGGPAAYRVDNKATAAMMSDLLPDALRTPGPNSKVRVLVQNGVGSPGLNAAARQLLIDAGFTYVNGGNAAKFGQVATAIVVPNSKPESLTWGTDIAKSLSVPSTAVQVATSGQSIADVIVVLGSDFAPVAH